MTIIALINAPATPIVLSDMLISTEGENSEIFIPTLGDLDELQKTNGVQLPFTATRMTRKPYRVGNASLVAWAGPLDAGQAVQAHLKEHCSARRVEQSDIDTAFWNLSLADQKRFSIIAVTVPPDASPDNWRDNVEVAFRGCLTFQSKIYGKCLFGGSGATYLERYVRERDDLYSRVHKLDLGSDSIPLLGTAVCARLIFRETILFEDPRTKGLTAEPLLREGCGGFFEAYSFTNTGVMLPRSCVYVHINVEGPNNAAQVTRAFYFTSRGQTRMVFSLLAEPADIPGDGQVLLGNELIDLESVDI